MWTRAVALTGTAIILATPALVSAQAEARASLQQPWWLSAEVQSQVGLSSMQIQQLGAIYDESLPARRRLRAQLRTLHNQLTKMLDEGRVDDAHGRRVIETVFVVEKQRNIARTWMLIRMYRVLTPEQRETLNALSARLSTPNVPR